MYTIICSNRHAKVRWKYEELNESLSKWALKCITTFTKLTIKWLRILKFHLIWCLFICSQISKIIWGIWALSKPCSNLLFTSKIDIMIRFSSLSKTTSRNIIMFTSNFMTPKITFTQTKILIDTTRIPTPRTSNLSERGSELLGPQNCLRKSLRQTSGNSLIHIRWKRTAK